MLRTVTNWHVWNRRLHNQTEKVPCTVLLNYLHTLVFSILILFIYIINIRYQQALFITQEQLGKSQSANSIIMISKGYHYVINLGIVSNFCISIDISIDPVYPGSLSKNLSQQVKLGESGISLLHRSSSPLSTMSFHRAQLEQHL